ncbi:MAG: Two-component transcriptional response regulator, LuxR family, partial [uncultured Blastococcus sp.]
DPGAHRRGPVARAWCSARPAGTGGGPGGRRRGRARRRRRPRRPGTPPRRRPARHRDARWRRHRGRSRAGRGRTRLPSGHPDDVRAAGFPAAGHGGRCRRLPGEGRTGGRAGPRDPRGDGGGAGDRPRPRRRRARRRGHASVGARGRRAARGRRRGHRRRHRRAAVPVRGDGAQLPVVGHREDRSAHPRGGGPGGRRQGLAL